jgi:hypothetical protein
MKITRTQLETMIREELNVLKKDPLEEYTPRKSTDLDYAKSSPRDQIGRVEAIKLIGNLEDMGYVSSRGAVTQLIDFLQALENGGDIRHGGWE